MSSKYQNKFDRQKVVVAMAAQFQTGNQRLEYLKSVEEFKKLKDDSILDKFRRWTYK